MEEALLMAAMEKTCQSLWNISSWFVSPMENTWFYENLLLEMVIVMVKDNKIQQRRYSVNQNYFYALHEVDKSNITSSF